MSEFHFLRPFWLLALIPLALLSWRLRRQKRGAGDWQSVCDPALLPYVLVHAGGGTAARSAYWLFALGGLLAVLALAGPTWERLPAPAFRNEAALVIALDLSRIMEAADLKPSRLERARFKIADILRQRKDGLTALLVYSGDAFTVTPLTDDSATIASQLSSLTTDLMPAQGSRAEVALGLAGRLLQQAGLTRGDVLLISNGVNLDEASSAARKLKSQGYRVSVLGAGSEEGAPVPLPQGGFLQDSKGSIVISKLAAPALRQLAEEGGGLYQKMSTDNADLGALLAFFAQQVHPDRQDAKDSGLKIAQWEDLGPWLLLPLLSIAALAFRRGVLGVLLLLTLPFPQPADALEWQDLWQTRDQRASRAFREGEPAKAAEVFADPSWKAAAQYRAGQYEAAAKTLQGLDSADARYNLGNALARQGRYPEAIAAYEQALRLDPENQDARYNKELVEKALQDQEKQQEKDNSGKDRDKQGGGKEGQDRRQDQGRSGQSQGEKSAGQQEQTDPQGNGDENEEKGKGAQTQPSEAQGKEADGVERESRSQAEKEQAESGALQPGSGGQRREDLQANEQWLRRIPDDPGGLLRRKFQYQYQQRQSRRGITQ